MRGLFKPVRGGGNSEVHSGLVIAYGDLEEEYESVACTDRR